MKKAPKVSKKCPNGAKSLNYQIWSPSGAGWHLSSPEIYSKEEKIPLWTAVYKNVEDGMHQRWNDSILRFEIAMIRLLPQQTTTLQRRLTLAIFIKDNFLFWLQNETAYSDWCCNVTAIFDFLAAEHLSDQKKNYFWTSWMFFGISRNNIFLAGLKVFEMFLLLVLTQ